MIFRSPIMTVFRMSSMLQGVFPFSIYCLLKSFTILCETWTTNGQNERPSINFSLFWRRELETLACAVTIPVLLSFWLGGKFTRTRQLSVDQCSRFSFVEIMVSWFCAYRLPQLQIKAHHCTRLDFNLKKFKRFNVKGTFMGASGRLKKLCGGVTLKLYVPS